jgi:hypothetical protein
LRHLSIDVAKPASKYLRHHKLLSQNAMPVRKINLSRRALTGRYHSSENSDKHDFESSLERDFLYLVDFDPAITNFETQPVTIEYEENGKKRKYTPDLLINYYYTGQGERKKPLLCEVKYRADIKKNWKLLKPKFIAAMKYADSMNWKFKIMTEVEIRSAYLENIKFLCSFKTIDIKPELIHQILDSIEEMEETTPQNLLLASSTDLNRRAELIPALWFLISNFIIGCDLKQRLTMNSTIWAK